MPGLRFLGGSRAGLAQELAGDVFTVGRHPDCDVVFDAAEHPTVSVRHAEIVRKGGAWYLRDLGSRNGTYLGGRRVEGDTRLSDGDTVRFGVEGPEVRFHDPEARSREPARAGLVTAALVITSVIAVVGVANWAIAPARWARERARLGGRIDSLIAEGVATERDLTARLDGLDAALRETEALLEASRSQDARPEEGPRTQELEELRRRILVATADLERLQMAAAIDADEVARRARPGVALVYVRSGDGRVSTGSAFAVREDAVLVTNAHVVRDPGTGTPVRELRIQFSDSDQVWRGTVLAVSSDADLALIRAEGIRGSVPTISFNQRADTVLPGSPVVIIGFPLGGDPEVMEGTRRVVARPLVLTGVTSRVTPSRLEVVGYGERGASGSPVLDARGEALGVVLGAPETARTTLLAVPIAKVVELLAGR